MNSDEFATADGWTVRLAALHIEPMLSGVLEGTTEGIRRGVLRDAKWRMRPAWGELPTIVLEPTGDNRVNQHLPRWKVHVRLEADRPLSAERYGSELAVAFFVDTISDEPVSQIISDRVSTIEWAKHAADHDGP